MKKETKIQLIIIVILIIILVPLVIITINTINNQGFSPEFDKNFENRKFGNPNEEQEEKETNASDVEAGEIVTQKEINLSEYNSNITIEDSGEYTLKGDFSNSVLINSTSDVTLILDNVTIQSDNSSDCKYRKR